MGIQTQWTKKDKKPKNDNPENSESEVVETTQSLSSDSGFIESLEEVLKKNLKLIGALLALVVLGVFGKGVLESSNEKAMLADSKVFYEFRENFLNPYIESQDKTEKKDEKKAVKIVTVDALATELGNVLGATKTAAGADSVLLSVDELSKAGKDQLALDLLTKWDSRRVKHPALDSMVEFRFASLYENLGKNKEAIASLQKLLNSKILSAKVYLDLGRLYSKEGDAQKAKSSFDHIIATFPNTNWEKMAKIFSAKLK